VEEGAPGAFPQEPEAWILNTHLHPIIKKNSK